MFELSWSWNWCLSLLTRVGGGGKSAGFYEINAKLKKMWLKLNIVKCSLNSFTIGNQRIDLRGGREEIGSAIFLHLKQRLPCQLKWKLPLPIFCVVAFKGPFKGLSKKLKGCFMDDWRLFWGNFMGVSRVFKSSPRYIKEKVLKEFLGVFQGAF